LVRDPGTGQPGGHRQGAGREADAHHRQRLAAFELTVERARYEAERSHRQYDAVEPENRLVARTLERALEDKLAALRQAENDLATQRARRPVTLTEDEAAWIRSAVFRTLRGYGRSRAD
jgi:hypothetical protein